MDAEPADNRRSQQPGKADDVFASFDDLVPVTFLGVRAHLFASAGAKRSVPSSWSLPPTDTDPRRWSATSSIKVHRGDINPDTVSLSAAYDVRWPRCLAYAMADLRICDGHWNFEAYSRFAEDRVHVSAVGQVANWSRMVTARYGVDYLWPYSTASVSVDPKNDKCSFQFLKSLTDRLSASCELAYKMNAKQFGMAATFKYAGPSYLFSGKASTGMPSRSTSSNAACKLAYYQHCSEWLQMGTMVEWDTCRSAAVTRLAFRVMSDASSVFRAAVGTDGIVNSMWERRLNDRLCLSFSLFVNHLDVDHGAGVGLSFD